MKPRLIKRGLEGTARKGQKKRGYRDTDRLEKAQGRLEQRKEKSYFMLTTQAPALGENPDLPALPKIGCMNLAKILKIS